MVCKFSSVLVIGLCVKNYHKLKGIKQHKFIISKYFVGQESGPSLAGLFV